MGGDEEGWERRQQVVNGLWKIRTLKLFGYTGNEQIIDKGNGEFKIWRFLRPK